MCGAGFRLDSLYQGLALIPCRLLRIMRIIRPARTLDVVHAPPHSVQAQEGDGEDFNKLKEQVKLLKH